MMKTIDTLRFGKIDFDEAQIFSFPMGLLGFAQRKEFVIVDHEGTAPFKWMQSLEDPMLAFVLSDPLLFYPQYQAQIHKNDLIAIDADKEENLVLSVIMTIPENTKDISANLCAPLIFNLENRKGMQFVLSDRRYPVKHFLFAQNSTSQPSQNIGTPSTDHRSLSLR
jgi:flagellar assembly factor FliW